MTLCTYFELPFFSGDTLHTVEGGMQLDFIQFYQNRTIEADNDTLKNMKTLKVVSSDNCPQFNQREV